jgi:hypothetical protein
MQIIKTSPNLIENIKTENVAARDSDIHKNMILLNI